MLDASSLEAGSFALPSILVLLTGAGVYIYQERPYNNVVSLTAPFLLIGISQLILFALAMGGVRNPGLIGVTPMIATFAGIITLAAGLLDAIEYFV